MDTNTFPMAVEYGNLKIIKWLMIKLIGLKKINIIMTQIVWIIMAINIVLYKPILSRIKETIKPADINPRENEPAIIPIIPSEKPSYLAIITMRVKKYPSAIPVNKAEIDKYFTLEFMLLKST